MSLKDDILREAVNKVHGGWDLDDHLLRRQRISWNIERIRGCSGLPVSGRETLSLEVIFGFVDELFFCQECLCLIHIVWRRDGLA